MAASSILGPSPYSFPIILPPSSLVPDNYRLTRSFSPEMPRSFHGKQNSTEIEYNSFPLDGTGRVGGIHSRAKWSLLGYFAARYSATFGQKLKSSFSTVLLSEATGNLLEITRQLLQSPPCRPEGERRGARDHGEDGRCACSGLVMPLSAVVWIHRQTQVIERNQKFKNWNSRGLSARGGGMAKETQALMRSEGGERGP